MMVASHVVAVFLLPTHTAIYLVTEPVMGVEGQSTSECVSAVN